MRLSEVIINITTRYLEQERLDFVNAVSSIIENYVLLSDDEFERLLTISSLMLEKYMIEDSEFDDILDSFSKLVSHHRRIRK